MKKVILGLIVITIALGVVFWWFRNSSAVVRSSRVIDELGIEVPERPADIMGTVIQVEGDTFTIESKVRTEELSDEEKELKREEMKNLSYEERQALREERLASGEIQTEKKELVIPVGTVIIKGSGDSSGNLEQASFAELKAGSYVSIWLNEDSSVYLVKIRANAQ